MQKGSSTQELVKMAMLPVCLEMHSLTIGTAEVVSSCLQKISNR